MPPPPLPGPTPSGCQWWMGMRAAQTPLTPQTPHPHALGLWRSSATTQPYSGMRCQEQNFAAVFHLSQSTLLPCRLFPGKAPRGAFLSLLDAGIFRPPGHSLDHGPCTVLFRPERFSGHVLGSGAGHRKVYLRIAVCVLLLTAFCFLLLAPCILCVLETCQVSGVASCWLLLVGSHVSVRVTGYDNLGASKTHPKRVKTDPKRRCNSS